MFHDPSKSVTNRMLQEAQKLTNKPYLDLSHLGKQVGGGQK